MITWRFDGIVGPTHHYGGLAYGNVASIKHGEQTSYPRAAALQGLNKMKAVMDLTGTQAFLPPHPRPHLPTLRDHGYEGSVDEILRAVQQDDPELLSAVCSASSMWAANAATVSPSTSTSDSRIHITPANLVSQSHRAIEPPVTTRFLRAVFNDADRIVVHDPLEGDELVDEGAANHMLMADGETVEIFVYGREEAAQPTEQYPARQTLKASRAVARQHGLEPERTLFLQQNPRAVDAGVFHNDVIAVTHQTVCFRHEDAYTKDGADSFKKVVDDEPGTDRVDIVVREREIPLERAVQTYLFNSQIISRPDGSMLLLAAEECRQDRMVRTYLEDTLLADSSHPLDHVRYVDVRESMKNGGGPACLRLRVPLAGDDSELIPEPITLTPTRYEILREWIQDHYRESLTVDELGGAAIYRESHEAISDLWKRLQLDRILSFDRYWEGPHPK